MALKLAKTKYGWIRGLSSSIPTVTVFRGIPYAKPPVGPLRWRPPQPTEPWEGEFEAFRYGPMPLQDKSHVPALNRRDFADYGMDEANDEDCLYLNIWTPAADDKAHCPVMVWIHGGGFVEDYAYDVVVSGDTYGARHGVILVSIEYRVGILGFLAHPDLKKESPDGSCGNYGLLDQQAAIRWVKENIEAFGGDPGNITIFGESAGAVSVSCHLCAPSNRGLFQKAIMQSGGGYSGTIPNDFRLMPIPTAELVMEQGIHILERLGVSSIEEARKLPPERFLEAQRNRDFPIGPVTDGSFLTKSPDETYAAGEDLQVPVIIGCNADEGNLFRKQNSPFLTMNREKYLQAVTETFGEQAEEYLEKAGFRENPEKALMKPAQMVFSCPSAAMCELRHRQNCPEPVYMYVFDRRIPGDDIGPAHAMEMMYVFHTLHRNWRPFDMQDYLASDRMAALWCNFARTGNPNGESLPVWDRYDRAGQALFIGESAEMGEPLPDPCEKMLVERILADHM